MFYRVENLKNFDWKQHNNKYCSECMEGFDCDRKPEVVDHKGCCVDFESILGYD